MWYSGIDLHRDNSFISTLDDAGELVRQERIENSPELLLSYFQSLPGQHTAVVESTTGWYWLSDLLEANNISVTLAHAKYLKAITYAKVKTDKVDSHTLATLLRQKLIPRAHKISPELRGFRDTMRIRLRLIDQRTASYRRCSSIRAKFNADDAGQLPPAYQVQMASVETMIDVLSKQILTLEKSLHPHLIPNADIQRLMHVPGIAKLTAFTVYLEVDGIERFSTVKQFLSYCLLVPGAENSNRRIRHRASRDGNMYLKIAFNHAGVHAVQYYPEIRDYFNRMKRRTNQPIARTLIAKELAKIVYHMLKNGDSYRGFKGRPISHHKSRQWPRLPSPDA